MWMFAAAALQDEVYCWGDFEPTTAANGVQNSSNQVISDTGAEQGSDEPWRVMGRQTSQAANRWE